jgi:hypothetical protein
MRYPGPGRPLGLVPAPAPEVRVEETPRSRCDPAVALLYRVEVAALAALSVASRIALAKMAKTSANVLNVIPVHGKRHQPRALYSDGIRQNHEPTTNTVAGSTTA